MTKQQLIEARLTDMMAAEAVFRAERTPEAQAAYRAANEAYNAVKPAVKLFGRACAAGKRQHAEQRARTQAAMLAAALKK